MTDEHAEIRKLTTYHLARLWLSDLADPDGKLPLTERVRLAVVTVADEMRSTVLADPRRHPTTYAALNDPRLGESMAIALVDMGAVVDQMPTQRLDASVLACNLDEPAVRLRRSQQSMTNFY